MEGIMESKATRKQGERGIVLVLALLMLLVLTLIGGSSMSSTNFEVLI
jgi:Tfp pilus assembly protein PilX